MNPGSGFFRAPLRIPVLDAQFFLKLRLDCGNANGVDMLGYIRVIEGVNAEALANFL